MVRISAALVAATAALAAITLPDAASAHGGQPAHARTPERLQQRRLFMAEGKRSLKDCANSDASRRLQERAVARRAAKADSIRAERRQRQRRLDLDTVLATSHKSNLTGLTADTNSSELFGDDVKCILEPEVTQGPYYVNGEPVRSDIREDQEGVDLYAEIQIVDVNTCEPVEGLYLDFWHCNATGVYSGIVASGNGDSSDTTNLDKTFLRGLTPTDEDGVASYTSIFPGHYTSRATHIHIIGTYNGTLLENNTYSGGYASHVGQLFFDQDLISEVELTAPYSTNTQELTTNADDSILSEEAAEDFDPVFEYVLLGDSVSDGVLAWISVGVDMTRAQTITAAGTLTADGGVMADSTSTTTGGAGGMGGGSGVGGFGGSVGGPGSGPANGFAGSAATLSGSSA
ncbi:LYR motif containing protein 1 [Phytophthora cinnamomi]|uniref:LYR motif containing protein 1 n=2 Tax=Phytophthora cinnamomi TaxID=4785 RepID=UPI00355A6776|nr:LYR motif containing protein 1 [Phytophthora cinnamomi]